MIVRSSKLGRDYLIVDGGVNYLTWHAESGVSTLTGYICEWDYENHISTATLPDINANGKDELASLFVERTARYFYVRAKDVATGAWTRTSLYYGSTATAKPIAVLGLADISGNAKPEIAVLTYNYTTKNPVVIIKDSVTGLTVQTISAFSAGYDPVDFSIVKDMNGNGSPEISIVAEKAGLHVNQFIDSKTKALISQFTM